MTVTFYFVRSACRLACSGLQQADALGAAFACKSLNAIYASPLKRAHSTALALAAGQPCPPPMTVLPDLREQYFGIAEGKRFACSGVIDLQREIFPVQRGRTDSFPEGESRDDVRARGERVLSDIFMRHIWEARGRRPGEVRVAVVSHGVCIAELVEAFLGRVPQFLRRDNCWFRGVHNTAFHELEVGLEEEMFGVADLLDGLPFDCHAPLDIKVQDVNNHWTPSENPAQSKITAYLAGNTRAIECDGP
ncbi:phosphoglycerate mutase-like protein [Auriculariales sp. MPI-PUGE-AT-0066]|nr:phosphoglycerate mutase-like protein [Auriculariales sp. MPI-PUGE-AT-0066]